jgi:phage anti-repressor protein
MQELIKIEKQVIGAEELNAVKARELHSALDIQKDFTDWIKAQISRAGLRENVDYVILKVASDGGRPSKDYILTADSGKHIAMMSQGTKAKEVRDYFIAVEKEYKANTSTSDLGAVVEMIVKQQNSILEILKVIAQKITEPAQDKISLKPEQLGKIRGAVNEACIPIMEFFQDDDEGGAKKAIYSKLNNLLGTPSYIYIPASAFAEAITILENLKEKYYKKLETRKEMKLDINESELPQF